MFCYQCEQTARTDLSAGCNSSRGMCGKDAATSDLQDALIYALKGLAQYSCRARSLGVKDGEVDSFILMALFTTLTNVNFNPTRFTTYIQQALSLRDKIKSACECAAEKNSTVLTTLTGPAAWEPSSEELAVLSHLTAADITSQQDEIGEDIIGLRALVLYGLKGVAAYAHHADVLGFNSEEVFAAVEETLEFLANQPVDMNALLEMALKLGAVNLKVMELLDKANTSRFGTPQPSQVLTSAIQGKAILVSGHDLGDLEAVLKATEGSGINVYTHGELLPAHGYPKLKAFSHLAGNYGGAWQDQQQDFAAFPGPILMTSNCIIEPQASYRQRIFTTGPVGWPGVRHLENHQFAPLIAAAKALPGFKENQAEKMITVGFGADAVLGVAGDVISAVKSGAIRHFLLIGGCDGAAPGRNYYTEIAEKAPQDTVILTLGCNKYRFNNHDFGTVAGLPRLLDIGQCNDTYSAIRIASALAEAFECGVNDLPLSLIVSWFEQKAAAVLLTLLALGIKNIRLGPTLPAFLSPAVVGILVEKFALKPIGTADSDLADILTPAA